MKLLSKTFFFQIACWKIVLTSSRIKHSDIADEHKSSNHFEMVENALCMGCFMCLVKGFTASIGNLEFPSFQLRCIGMCKKLTHSIGSKLFYKILYSILAASRIDWFNQRYGRRQNKNSTSKLQSMFIF